MNDTIGPAEAAAILRLTTARLRQMRLDGTGPKYTAIGPADRPRFYYRRADVLAWQATRYAATKLHSSREGSGGRSGPGPDDPRQLDGTDDSGSLLYRFPGYQPPAENGFTEGDLAA